MSQIWESFLLGLDYRLQDWRSFDHALFEGYLARMAGLGMGVLRLPLVWAAFQPEPKRLSDRCLRDLEAAMNTAAAYRVGLVPALFSSEGNGSLRPDWVFQEGKPTLEGQVYLLEVLLSYFRGHRAILAWELNAAGAADPGQVEGWRDYVFPAVRQADPRHPLALGVGGDELTGGNRPLLEGLAPHVDLMVIDWTGPHGLAPLACALAWRLAGKRSLVSVRRAPSGGLEAETLLRGLCRAGALGVLLPASGDQTWAGEEHGEALGKVIAEAWVVAEQPAAVAVDPDSFYGDPLAGWETLAREWQG